METETTTPTPAELLGMTGEVGRGIASIAAEELRQGRVSRARDLAEGLVVLNPYDPAGWLLLAEIFRKGGDSLAMRFTSGVALMLAPDDPAASLSLAESLMSEKAR